MSDWTSELPALAELDDQAAADAINAMTVNETYMRFGSLRTMAALLTAEEYTATKAAITTAAASSVVAADMLGFLALPGGEDGRGGGLDFGNESVRGMLDQFCTAEVAAKIKAYAERTVQKYPFLYSGQIAEARKAVSE